MDVLFSLLRMPTIDTASGELKASLETHPTKAITCLNGCPLGGAKGQSDQKQTKAKNCFYPRAVISLNNAEL
jgi:hypothetical protein